MDSEYSTVVILPIAHLAHWYFFPLYAAPVLVVLWSALSTARRERRAKSSEGGRRGPSPTD